MGGLPLQGTFSFSSIYAAYTPGHAIHGDHLWTLQCAPGAGYRYSWLGEGIGA